jgi:hypothetical protein
MVDVRIQFILKRRLDYSGELHGHHKTLSTGLFNSVNFLHEMLPGQGIASDLIVAVDNNQIDREVRRFQPTHCVIEALWVVPTKFAVLTRLHPKVTWIVRLHSELPFIANEGIAMDWIAEYVRYPNVIIGVNAPRMLEETRSYLMSVMGWDYKTAQQHVIYLPNFYPQQYRSKPPRRLTDRIDVGCFGAVRPLKNHLVQAVAAVKFADQRGFKLNFHINGNRMEMKGEPVMNNLKGMFAQLADRGHELILHDWRPREGFLDLCHEMDLGLQVSFSETFNIVGADMVSQGVPLVPSVEIPWANEIFTADPTNSDDIAAKMHRALRYSRANVWLHKKQLNAYTNETIATWKRWFTT